MPDANQKQIDDAIERPNTPFVWIVDGATIQHTGELVFDHTDTKGIRGPNREAYLACLEDFVFLSLYSDSIVTAGTMPSVGSSNFSPGEELLRQFSDLKRHRLEGSRGKPETLLQNAAVRQVIKTDIISLDLAFHINRQLWQDWLDREIQAYLGQDQSLLDPNLLPSLIVFAKTPAYMQDQELQDAVPQAFIASLAPRVIQLRSRCTHNAAVEFVTRCAVTLVTIANWFDSLYTSQGEFGIRLPFSVRSLLKQASTSLTFQGKRRTARRLLVMDALSTIVTRYYTDKRSQFLDTLHSLRYQEPYSTNRRLWKEFEFAMEHGEDPGIDKLIGDLMRSSVANSDKIEPVAYQRSQLSTNPDAGVVRRILRCYDDIKPDEVYGRLYKVFPELTPGNDRVSIATHRKPSKTDVLIVTATTVESNALINVFEQTTLKRLHGTVNTYHDFGMIDGKQVHHVECLMGSFGVGGVIAVVVDAINDLNPRKIILTGIAFGVRPEIQNIGDVYVCEQLFGYDRRKITDEGSIQRGDKVTPSADLLSQARSAALTWKSDIKYGLMASGETLWNSEEAIINLLSSEKEISFGDMEAYGVYSAAGRVPNVDWIVIKAISDFGKNKDVNKDQIQRDAARSACEFVRHFIACLYIENSAR